MWVFFQLFVIGLVRHGIFQFLKNCLKKWSSRLSPVLHIKDLFVTFSHGIGTDQPYLLSSNKVMMVCPGNLNLALGSLVIFQTEAKGESSAKRGFVSLCRAPAAGRTGESLPPSGSSRPRLVSWNRLLPGPLAVKNRFYKWSPGAVASVRDMVYYPENTQHHLQTICKPETQNVPSYKWKLHSGALYKASS